MSNSSYRLGPCEVDDEFQIIMHARYFCCRFMRLQLGKGSNEMSLPLSSLHWVDITALKAVKSCWDDFRCQAERLAHFNTPTGETMAAATWNSEQRSIRKRFQASIHYHISILQRKENEPSRGELRNWNMAQLQSVITSILYVYPLIYVLSLTCTRLSLANILWYILLFSFILWCAVWNERNDTSWRRMGNMCLSWLVIFGQYQVPLTIVELIFKRTSPVASCTKNHATFLLAYFKSLCNILESHHFNP